MSMAMATGLKPREFTWVIAESLAASERIGGHSFQHRRVRREEEIAWLNEAGITSVVSLLPSNQNLASYEAAGFEAFHEPLDDEYEPGVIEGIFSTISKALSPTDAKVLVHRDHLDDMVAGVLAGYLVHSGLVSNQILAAVVIQEIIGRPLGPEGRSLIPSTA
jgi:hypothetical protein